MATIKHKRKNYQLVFHIGTNKCHAYIVFCVVVHSGPRQVMHPGNGTMQTTDDRNRQKDSLVKLRDTDVAGVTVFGPRRTEYVARPAVSVSSEGGKCTAKEDPVRLDQPCRCVTLPSVV